jgi:hypothetical protein
MINKRTLNCLKVLIRNESSLVFDDFDYRVSKLEKNHVLHIYKTRFEHEKQKDKPVNWSAKLIANIENAPDKFVLLHTLIGKGTQKNVAIIFTDENVENLYGYIND